jgi:hypothetical protein
MQWPACQDDKGGVIGDGYEQDSSVYAPEFVELAKLMLSSGGVDARKWEHPLVKRLCRVYLPLASNTEFVEGGVKASVIVAATGRHEETRSAYVINRSVRVHCDDISSDSPAPKRIAALLAIVELPIQMKQKVKEVSEVAY